MLDIVVCTPQTSGLNVLLVRAQHDAQQRRKPWRLPCADFIPGKRIDAAAAQIAARALGRAPAWLAQIGAFGNARMRQASIVLSVAYVGVVPFGAGSPDGTNAQWFTATDLPPLPPHDAAIVYAALATLRERLDRAPIAFRLLPRAFTLSDLQAMYELLLGHRLHKASFRRSLRAALLVEPTGRWRVEARGRPAQLFRYAPSSHPRRNRSVRFDLLSG